jgi:hypothetical protein
MRGGVMKTGGHTGYSIVDSALFAQRTGRPGVDVVRAPGHVWLRGELDDSETVADFLSRAKREAAEAGFQCVEFSGRLNLTEGE